MQTEDHVVFTPPPTAAARTQRQMGASRPLHKDKG